MTVDELIAEKRTFVSLHVINKTTTNATPLTVQRMAAVVKEGAALFDLILASTDPPAAP